jgi:hypothetical protein
MTTVMKTKYIEGTKFFLYQLVSEISEGRSIFDLAAEHDVDPNVFKKALEELSRDLQGGIPLSEMPSTESASA